MTTSDTIGLNMATLKDNPQDARALEWNVLNRSEWPTAIYDLIEACIMKPNPRNKKIIKKENYRKNIKPQKQNTTTTNDHEVLNDNYQKVLDIVERLMQKDIDREEGRDLQPWNRNPAQQDQRRYEQPSSPKPIRTRTRDLYTNPTQSNTGNYIDGQEVVTDEEQDPDSLDQSNHRNNWIQPKTSRQNTIVVIPFDPETMILPETMKKDPSQSMKDFFNTLACTRGDILDPRNVNPRARMPIFKVQLAPMFMIAFRDFETLVMKDAATREFASWHAAYEEVKATKAVGVLQEGFKPSLQNTYSDLFQTKHGMATLTQIKHGAPILLNRNLRTVKGHDITNFFHECRVYALLNGFNNSSFYDYCIQVKTVGQDIIDLILKKCETPNVKFLVAKYVSVFIEQVIKDCLTKDMEYEDLKDKITSKHVEKL